MVDTQKKLRLQLYIYVVFSILIWASICDKDDSQTFLFGILILLNIFSLVLVVVTVIPEYYPASILNLLDLKPYMF